jgi:hypothetical protein
MVGDRVRQAKVAAPHTILDRRCVIVSTEKCALTRCNGRKSTADWRYRLTTGSGIVEALVRVKVRDMRLTANKTTPCPAANGVELLAAAGVPFWIDGQAGIAHQDNGDRRRGHAYGFDDELDSWARCQLRKPQPRLLARFRSSLRCSLAEPLAVSVRYERRGDWCRASSREVRLGARR